MINIFEKLFPKDLYHSYLIEGDPEKVAVELLAFLEMRGEIEKKSPDVLCQVYESFAIDDSGEIKNWHSRLGVGQKKKICIIATKFINREAEQTLLKIIEEPAKDTHFFIIVPDTSVLLPTIISRCHIVKTEQSNDKNLQKIAQDFVVSGPKKRLSVVLEIIKENKSDENSGQLRAYATMFINEIEKIYYQKFKKNKNDKNIKYILNELQKNREYLSTPGASVKMILEHLALVI